MGLGMVVRNHLGRVMASRAQHVVGIFSPHVVKAMGILRGIRFAMDSGLVPLVMESDALNVVSMINDSSPISSDVCIIILDIKDCIDCLLNVNVSYVPRVANVVAHKLSKIGIFATNDCIWL